MGDAIVRTLYRLLISRRRLLEWVSAAQVKANSSLDLGKVYTRMAGAVTLAVIAGALAASRGLHVSSIAFTFVALWLLSPAVARWLSLPPRARPIAGLAPEEVIVLRAAARRSWRFFETFVGAEDHTLPPDNFQEDPRPVVAHRTSPTNMGLYLLSAASARDLGWIGTLDLADRLHATLAGMEPLERFRGHFYNWYDTSSLRPLEPRYVSSVDSGNLAGHLHVLAIGLRERGGAPLVDRRVAAGIEDALLVLAEALGPAQGEADSPPRRLHAAVEALRATLSSGARHGARLGGAAA